MQKDTKLGRTNHTTALIMKYNDPTLRDGACKYYRGAFGPLSVTKTCEAGIDLRKLVGGDDHGWVKRLPCYREHETDIKCDKYKEPTLEEIRRDEEIQKEIMGYGMMAITTIKDKVQDQTEVSGTITCPRCGGSLMFYINPNRHITASCKAPECLRIME